MNEHDMISNISYIMHLYPETTEEILIKHGADPSKEYWTDGCDVASAYDELLQWLNSRYDRNDPETELDYHIQEILGWHDVNEATQLDESNNVMSDQKYISAFLSSVDDPSQFLSARLQKSITVNCYLNTAKFSDGAPVLKYFYRGKFTTLYDRTIGRGRWIIIDPDSYGYVYDAKNSGWLQFQLHSSEHASCLSTSVLKKLSELTGDYSWFDTDTDSNISESVASNIEIPAPYNQYYEFSPNEVNFDELPDAFDHYKELKVIAELYAKEQYEDALANNCLDFCWLVEDEIGKLLLVTTAGLRVYPITLEEIQDCVGDGYDDYEDLDEAVEMSDAQRLALQELDAALDCGELDAEKHALAYQIQWDINFEDVVLFINGIDIDLKDIEHVAYGDCDETKFDGCYSVTLRNGEVKKYGWHDFDMTGSLTCIDCNEAVEDNKLTEADDGWDKPFDWTERYVKDGFVITGNYDRTSWHLEQTRPRTKHFGNYKTLEAAKVAGDKEIAAKNAGNRGKEPQFGVHQFSTDSIIFRGTEEECGNYIDGREHLWNDAEIYMIMPDDPNYRDLNEETASRRFNPGDRVYVTVSNRQGTVNKMISDDVVEVEFEANGTYPARIDRYYVDEVRLLYSDDLDESTSSNSYLTETWNNGYRGHPVTLDGLISNAKKDRVNSGHVQIDLDWEARDSADYLLSKGYKVEEGWDHDTYMRDFSWSEYTEVQLCASLEDEYCLHTFVPQGESISFGYFQRLLKKHGMSLEYLEYYDGVKKTSVYLTAEGQVKEHPQVTFEKSNKASSKGTVHADNEPFINYLSGKYAKDLKRPSEGYVVYNKGVYIGHADSPEEARIMIQHAR